MPVECLQLLRAIGQFEHVDAGRHIPFTKLTLVYAENGRGKTTIATILRAAAANDSTLMEDRRRLGVQQHPHVVVAADGSTAVYQNGRWSVALPQIAVFDDAFVAANVCSGIAIDTAHRQNLHELILGAQGVALNTALRGYVARIEEHNRILRQREGAIPAAARGQLAVDAFCALPADPAIDAKIAVAERNLAAARSADAIRQNAVFLPLSLPALDPGAIDGLLSRTLPDLEAEAAARVRAHMQSLGKGGESWVADGMGRVRADAGDVEICPFCAQDLAGSDIIRHYQAYFSEAYEALKAAIVEMGQGVNTAHAGDVRAAFERLIRVAIQTRDFWRAFTEIPEIDVDTAAIMRAWTAARDAVLVALRAKMGAPIEARSLPPETLALIDAYDDERAGVAALSGRLQATLPAIAIVKEQAAAANVAALEADLVRLRAVKTRHAEPVATLCQEYLDEKAAKAVTENLRGQARDALDAYRRDVFPAYEAAINEYLQRFTAGFRLGAVNSVNTRAGSSCTYNVIINNVPVALTADQGPSFRNTLSAGDRNTLALAFFFASLEHDPDIGRKVVVIDDPMTSLDEHRSLTTVQEMRRLQGRVDQVLVLSHSKPFLCGLWEGADPAERSALQIVRAGDGSTLAAWDVRQDCITEHDRRHGLVADYLRAGDPARQRPVAEALRPMIEAFLRVAYPADFRPGTLIGPFLGICQQRIVAGQPILRQADVDELRLILPLVNRYHHDTNPAWQTAAINDQELLGFARRVLAFTRRG